MQGAFKQSVEGMYYIENNTSAINSNVYFINSKIDNVKFIQESFL